MSGPVYVIGCPRSGNTLLGAILNKHPDVFILFEANTFSDIYRRTCNISGMPRENFVQVVSSAFQNYHKKLDIGLDEFHVHIGQGSNWGEMFDSYMRLLMSRAKPDAKIWGDKTPHHLGNIEHILQVYPNARFIYTYRDPRDVVNSLSKPSFTPATQNKMQNAFVVRQYLEVYHQKKPHIPPEQLLEIRYEEFVEDYEGIIKSICSFLQIDYIPALLEPADNRIREIIGWPNDKAWGRVAPQKGAIKDDSSDLVGIYLSDWLWRQGYTENYVSHTSYWQIRAKSAVLPKQLLYGLYGLYWRTKYPGFPLLLLKLPYLQKGRKR